MPFLRTDHWRSAIVHAPMEALLENGSLSGHPITLLPDLGDHRFLADPFGVWRDGLLHVFVERLDYRAPKGVIDVVVYNRKAEVVSRREVLSEPWHLSYPYVFEHEGVTYLLPEASQSGRLSLYRAVSFPDRWERVEAFDFPIGAIDATPLYHSGCWWLFWTPPTPREQRQCALHISTAGSLTGKWRHLGLFLLDQAGARPGGTPVEVDGRLFLPTQDCRGTYGRGIRLLEIEGLARGLPKVTPDATLSIPAPLRQAFGDGIHTLSKAGAVTLLDVKRIGIGPRRDLMNIRRHTRNLLKLV